MIYNCPVFSGSLKEGQESREAVCVDQIGSVVDLGLCEEPSYEDTHRSCNVAPCHVRYYSVGPWSQCVCATRQQKRTIVCVDEKGLEVDEKECQLLDIQKPRSVQGCEPANCQDRSDLRKILQNGANIRDRCKGQNCSGVTPVCGCFQYADLRVVMFILSLSGEVSYAWFHIFGHPADGICSSSVSFIFLIRH